MENTVELIGYYGGDESIAQSAWTSTNRDLTDERKKRIPDLLVNKLRDADTGHLHTSPFEKAVIHFLVTSDVATHIHFLKHRIGVSINGESARYKELKDDKMYVPEDWPAGWQSKLEEFNQFAASMYHRALAELTPVIGRKRAKESARYFLPYSNQLTADVMFHFNTFMHFVELRYSEHAQREVRVLALEMLKLVFATGAFTSALEAYGWALQADGEPVKVSTWQLVKLK